MPRNATGNYTLPEAPFVAGTVISSAVVNDDLNDISLALTGSLSRNGQGGMVGQFKAIDGSTANPAIAFNNDLLTGIYRPADHSMAVVVDGVVSATFTPTGITGVTNKLVPTGAILDWTSTSPPTSWLFCYGQAVSRTTYPALFGVFGVTFGAGDGTTTFNLPDLRGRVIFGNDAMGGVAAGRLTTTFFGTDPTINGNVGGSQTRALLTANLPAYIPSGVIANGAITATPIPNSFILGTPFQGHGISGSSGVGTSDPLGISISVSQAASTFFGNSQGGGSVAFSLVNPAMILTKIICAGV